MRRLSATAIRGGIGIALVLALVLTSTAACAGRRGLSREEMWGPFRGRFVDADTGQPIAGGVAYAIWMKSVFHPVHSRQEFYAVRFAVTNHAGEYDIPALANAPVVANLYQGPYLSSAVPGHQAVEVDKSGSNRLTTWRRFDRLPQGQRRYGSGGTYTELIPEETYREVLGEINRIRRQMGLLPFRSLGGDL